MSQKESFTDRVNQYRQQAESQRQSDLVTRQQQQQQESEIKRQEEVRKQQETQERVRKTKENFAGTGIVEAFQEIIDSQTLIFARYYIEEDSGKGFFCKKKNSNRIEKIIPAKLSFNINEISLLYSVDADWGGDFPTGFYHKKLTVTKKENDVYELNLPIGPLDDRKIPKRTIGCPEAIIDSLANFIVNKSPEHGPYESFENRALLEYSQKIDELQ